MYEEMLQKLEGDIRMHLRHQNFLKLHIENIQNSLEQSEKEIQNLKTELKEALTAKEKLEKAYSKDMTTFKTQEGQLEKTVSELKDKICELNMYITTNNAGAIATIDKRDPLFMTLINHNSNSKSNKRATSGKRNESFKSKMDANYDVISVDKRYLNDITRSKSPTKRVVKLKPKNINHDKNKVSKKRSKNRGNIKIFTF